MTEATIKDLQDTFPLGFVILAVVDDVGTPGVYVHNPLNWSALTKIENVVGMDLREHPDFKDKIQAN